jgi:hypothetical protein
MIELCDKFFSFIFSILHHAFFAVVQGIDCVITVQTGDGLVRVLWRVIACCYWFVQDK